MWGLWKLCYSDRRRQFSLENRKTEISLRLRANIFADHFSKPALHCLSELIVVNRFLADDEAPAAVPDVQPFRCGGGNAARAIEARTRTQFDERSALRQPDRLFVFDPHQRRALIILEHTNRADRDPVSCCRLADNSPLSGRTNQGDHQNGGGYSRHDEEGLFQS